MLNLLQGDEFDALGFASAADTSVGQSALAYAQWFQAKAMRSITAGCSLGHGWPRYWTCIRKPFFFWFIFDIFLKKNIWHVLQFQVSSFQHQ